jgi:polysaccharide biosynthesis transport protein
MNSDGRSLTPGGGDRYLPALTRDARYLEPWDLTGPEDRDSIDLRAIWSAIYRNRYLILAILALSLAAGVASLYLMQPIYRATATVEIDQAPIKVLGTEDAEPVGGSAEVDRFLQTQVDILESRGLAVRVADSLNLAADDEFLKDMGKKPVSEGRKNYVVGTLMSNIDVDVPKKSRVVPIAFDSPSPHVAAAVANSYADNFIASNLQRRFDTTSYSRSFLQQQLNLTKARLEQSERALLGYARSAGIVDTAAGPSTGLGDRSAPHSLTTSNLVELNQAYAAARSERVQAQQRWQQAQSVPAMSLPEVLGNSTVQHLTQRRAVLQAEYQQQLQHRKPEHPSVKQAAAALEALDQQIATVASSIRDSIRNQYLVAARQESALAGNVGQLKGATLSEQDRGIRYNILKREVDTNRQMYDGLLQRFKEISAQSGITTNNISIVDRANPPGSPVSPKPMVNMALAGMGGLVLALLLVFAKEMVDDRVRSPDDVDEQLGVAFLGAVPRIRKRSSPQAALADPRSPMSEAYHTITAAVDLSSGNGPPGTLLVTSSRGAEGKSTSALAIAQDFAAAGKRTLLIDADMRNPSLHAVLGAARRPGLSNLLAQKIDPSQAIVSTSLTGLDFLPAGPQPPSPAELLAGKNFEQLLRRLKGDYDHIVVDSPPVLGLADAPQIAAVADATILVVESNKARAAGTKGALRRLMAAHANLIGVILAKFDPRKAGYRADYIDSYYTYGSRNHAYDLTLPRLNDGPGRSGNEIL